MQEIAKHPSEAEGTVNKGRRRRPKIERNIGRVGDQKSTHGKDRSSSRRRNREAESLPGQLPASSFEPSAATTEGRSAQLVDQPKAEKNPRRRRSTRVPGAQDRGSEASTKVKTAPGVPAEPGEVRGVADAEASEHKRERIKVNAHNISPTTSVPLWLSQLAPLRPFFESDKREELDPVVLIRSGKEIYLYDGNHRIFLAMEYGGDVDAEVYELGDNLPERNGAYKIDEYFIEDLKRHRQRTIDNEVVTFEDLNNLGFWS